MHSRLFLIYLINVAVALVVMFATLELVCVLTY